MCGPKPLTDGELTNEELAAVVDGLESERDLFTTVVAIKAERDNVREQANTMTEECTALRVALEEVRGLSSTCGYDWGNSRIHKLALDALAAAPETAKVSAVLEAARRLCAVWRKGLRTVRADGEISVESDLFEAVRAWRGEPK